MTVYHVTCPDGSICELTTLANRDGEAGRAVALAIQASGRAGTGDVEHEGRRYGWHLDEADRRGWDANARDQAQMQRRRARSPSAGYDDYAVDPYDR